MEAPFSQQQLAYLAENFGPPSRSRARSRSPIGDRRSNSLPPPGTGLRMTASEPGEHIDGSLAWYPATHQLGAWSPRFLFTLLLTAITHYYRSLTSLTAITHYYRSLPSVTAITHYYCSLPLFTAITHYWLTLLITIAHNARHHSQAVRVTVVHCHYTLMWLALLIVVAHCYGSLPPFTVISGGCCHYFTTVVSWSTYCHCLFPLVLHALYQLLYYCLDILLTVTAYTTACLGLISFIGLLLLLLTYCSCIPYFLLLLPPTLHFLLLLLRLDGLLQQLLQFHVTIIWPSHGLHHITYKNMAHTYTYCYCSYSPMLVT